MNINLDFVSCLIPDIYFSIVKFLDFQSVIRLIQVCKKYHTIFITDIFWKHIDETQHNILIEWPFLSQNFIQEIYFELNDIDCIHSMNQMRDNMRHCIKIYLESDEETSILDDSKNLINYMEQIEITYKSELSKIVDDVLNKHKEYITKKIVRKINKINEIDSKYQPQKLTCMQKFANKCTKMQIVNKYLKENCGRLFIEYVTKMENIKYQTYIPYKNNTTKFDELFKIECYRNFLKQYKGCHILSVPYDHYTIKRCKPIYIFNHEKNIKDYLAALRFIFQNVRVLNIFESRKFAMTTLTKNMFQNYHPDDVTIEVISFRDHQNIQSRINMPHLNEDEL